MSLLVCYFFVAFHPPFAICSGHSSSIQHSAHVTDDRALHLLKVERCTSVSISVPNVITFVHPKYFFTALIFKQMEDLQKIFMLCDCISVVMPHNILSTIQVLMSAVLTSSSYGVVCLTSLPCVVATAWHINM